MSNDDEPAGWGAIRADGFRLGPGDLAAPNAVETLLAAFRRQGVEFDPSSLRHQQLRWRLSSLATWSFAPPTELRTEDPVSRKLNERVERLAIQLREAIEAAWEYADEQTDKPETVLVETCQYMFPTNDSLREIQLSCLAIELASQEGARWTKQTAGKRGRHKLWLFYVFVQRLHEIYIQSTGQRGFIEPSGAGTAEGPFVTLVHECQPLMPQDLRHSDVKTTGNRVLAALAEENQDLAP